MQEFRSGSDHVLRGNENEAMANAFGVGVILTRVCMDARLSCMSMVPSRTMLSSTMART